MIEVVANGWLAMQNLQILDSAKLGLYQSGSFHRASPEGVDWPNCRKRSFLIFFPTCNHVNLDIVKEDNIHQKLVRIG